MIRIDATNIPRTNWLAVNLLLDSCLQGPELTLSIVRTQNTLTYGIERFASSLQASLWNALPQAIPVERGPQRTIGATM